MPHAESASRGDHALDVRMQWHCRQARTSFHLDLHQLCLCGGVSCQDLALLSLLCLGCRGEAQCHALLPLGLSVACLQSCLVLPERSHSLLSDHLQGKIALKLRSNEWMLSLNMLNVIWPDDDHACVRAGAM